MDNVAFVACFVDAKVGGISSKPTILPTGAPPLQKEFPQPLTSPHSNITISIDHGIPECLSKYGANLNEASCIDALIHIPLDSTSKVFGKRSDVGVEVGLPFRFSGADGKCAIEVNLGVQGRKDTATWAEMYAAARSLLEYCVRPSDPGGRRRGGLGGVVRELGQDKRLVVRAKSYTPNVQCFRRPFVDVGNHCLETLSFMNLSPVPRSWGRRTDPNPRRYDALLPNTYRDNLDACIVTEDILSGNIAHATFLEMWEAAIAVYWMCVRTHDNDGRATALGREGNLQLQLGRPSTGPNAVAVQRRVIPGNPDDNQVVQFKDTF